MIRRYMPTSAEVTSIDIKLNIFPNSFLIQDYTKKYFLISCNMLSNLNSFQGIILTQIMQDITKWYNQTYHVYVIKFSSFHKYHHHVWFMMIFIYFSALNDCVYFLIILKEINFFMHLVPTYPDSQMKLMMRWKTNSATKNFQQKIDHNSSSTINFICSNNL